MCSVGYTRVGAAIPYTKSTLGWLFLGANSIEVYEDNPSAPWDLVIDFYGANAEVNCDGPLP